MTETRAQYIEVGNKVNKRANALEYLARTLLANMDHPHFNREGFRLIPYADGSMYKTQPTHLFGEIRVRAGLRKGELAATLDKDDYAKLLEFLPWELDRHARPNVFVRNKEVVIQAPWPVRWITATSKLRSLGDQTLRALWRRGRIVVGQDTYGTLVAPQFGYSKSDAPHTIYHLSVGGMSGYGKTVLLWTMLYQLSSVPDAQIVLLDAKGGMDGLMVCDGIANQVGPAARQYEDVANALYWIYLQMEERYERMERGNPIIVAFSEFDTYLKDRDLRDPVAWLVNQLIRRGRSANIHLILETQSASVSNFADSSTRDMLDTVVAFRTKNHYATQQLVPDVCQLKPHVHLSLPGEAFYVTDSDEYRIMVPYAEEQDIEGRKGLDGFSVDDWPELNTAKMRGYEGDGVQHKPFTPVELAVGAHAASQGLGRKLTNDLLRQHAGRGMGSGRTKRLLEEGRQLSETLGALGFCDLPA